MAVINLDLWPHQIATLQSPKPVTCLAGGVGSGKTEVGGVYCLQRSFAERNSRGVIASNTYRQLQDSTLSRILQRLDEWKIKHKMNWHRMALRIGKNPEILCRTLTNWDKLAGIEIAWYYIDEAWGSPVDGFRELNRRLRCPHAKELKGLITTNLNGYDWIYDEFYERPFSDPNIRKMRALIRATTLDNPDLVEEYLANLRATMTKELLMQWVFAKFVNVNARACYYNFNRANHIDDEKAKFDPNLPLRFTMDFNYNPLCGSVGQQYRDICWTFKEYVLSRASTYDMCDNFLKDFGAFKGIVYVYGDATGRRHQSSSKHSDYDIIRKKLSPVYKDRLQFRVPSHNPSVRDRLNSVNTALKNAREDVRYFINSSCRKLMMDFETAENPELNPFAIDKRGADGQAITHPTDAVGYWLHKEFPVMKPTYGSVVAGTPLAAGNNQITNISPQELLAYRKAA